MCLLFETIRVENGVPAHLKWHEERMNRSRGELWPGEKPVILESLLVVPHEYTSGMVRCNIRYGRAIENITFAVCKNRPVRTLKIVNCDNIDYHLKFSNRVLLESLLLLNRTCDEIIIVKNGLVTDTSVSNLIFYNGTKWVTPAKPLLKGTCRERMLASGTLSEMDIRPEEIKNFEGCKLINALRIPEEEKMIPAARIFF